MPFYTGLIYQVFVKIQNIMVISDVLSDVLTLSGYLTEMQ